MWAIWVKWLLPPALNDCPKCKKSPNPVTLEPLHIGASMQGTPPPLLLPHNTKHLILISSASNNLHLQRLPPSILFPCLYPSNISSFHFVCLNLSPFMQCTIAISTTTTTTTSASSDNRSIINNNKNKNKKQWLRKGCFSFVSAEWNIRTFLCMYNGWLLCASVLLQENFDCVEKS